MEWNNGSNSWVVLKDLKDAYLEVPEFRLIEHILTYGSILCKSR